MNHIQQSKQKYQYKMNNIQEAEDYVKRQKIILENLKRVPHNYVKEKISEIEESVRIINNLLSEIKCKF